jgi:hypothetical protein
MEAQTVKTFGDLCRFRGLVAVVRDLSATRNYCWYLQRLTTCAQDLLVEAFESKLTPALAGRLAR